MIRASAVSALLILLVRGDPLGAQTQQRPIDILSMEMTRIASIRSSPGIAVSEHSSVARDSAGRFLVSVDGPRIAIFDSTGIFSSLLEWTSVREDRTAREVLPFFAEAPASYLGVFDGGTLTRFRSDGSAGAGDILAVTGRYIYQSSGSAYIMTPAPDTAPHAVGMRAIHSPTDERTAPPELLAVLDTVRSNPGCDGCPDALITNASYAFYKSFLLMMVADRYRFTLFDSWGSRQLFSQSIDVPWFPSQAAASDGNVRVMPEAPRLLAVKVDRCRTVCSDARIWVTGLLVRDSSAAADTDRYTTFVDLFANRSPRRGPYIPTELRLELSAHLEVAGRFEMFEAGLLFQRVADGAGRWALHVYRLDAPR